MARKPRVRSGRNVEQATRGVLTGQVWRFGDDVDTDAIIPGRFLTLYDPRELAKHAFEGTRDDFARGAQEGDLIVAGRNFGCGSSREHAPLALAEAGTKPDAGMKTTLYGFPFGLNQKQAQPRPLEVKASTEGQLITLERQLNPGESGAPLLTPEGKVLALAGGKNECIPIDLVRSLLN